MKKLILSAFLTVVVSHASATTYNINPSYINSDVAATGVIIGGHPARVGDAASGNGYGRCAVLAFPLPKIPFGETITGATFSENVVDSVGTFTFSGDLYSLGVLSGGSIGGTADYYQGAYGSNPNGTALQQGFLTPSITSGKITASASGNAAIAADFQALLGEGASIGDYYLLSLNPNFTSPSNVNAGWDVGLEQDVSNQPALSITTAQAPQCGRVLIEYWENLSPAPTSLAGLTGSAYYPNQPSAREFSTFMEIPPSLNSGSGDRLRGYFHVPTSGNYTFAIAGSDVASLLFSADGNPSHAVQIASSTSSTYQVWTPAATASPIALTAGQVCYIEAQHETNAGSTASCLSIGCQGPGDTGITLMPITNVSPFDASTPYSTGAIANALQPLAHPRLMISDACIQRLADEVTSTNTQYYNTTQRTNWGKIYAACVTPGSSDLMPNGDPYIEGALIGGSVLAAPSTSTLFQSIRQLQDRVYILSLYRLIEKKLKPTDPNIALAATQIYNEMTSAASWTAWGTQGWDKASELDIAEMSNVCAIAYDWNYDAWKSNTSECNFFVNTINKNILAEVDGVSDLAYPGVNQLTDTLANGTPGEIPGIYWFTGNNYAKNKAGTYSNSVASGNWPIVCTGGVLMSAIAVLGDESTYLTGTNTPQAANVIDGVTAGTGLMSNLSTLSSIKEWSNDGGWNEGMNYWNYAVRYLTNLYACLETSSGTCFGVDKLGGMSSIGSFPIYMNGPSGNAFNFSDCFAASYVEPACQYLGVKYNQPLYSYPENQTISARGHYPTDMIWFDARTVAPSSSLATSTYYTQAGGVTLRTDWTANALFVGMKAGYNGNVDQTSVSPYGSNHEFLQLGSFVFEALGVRWAEQAGEPDNYNNYSFDLTATDASNRWQYYRCRAEGNNTLVLNPSPDGGQYGGDGNPFANVTSNSGGNSTITKFLANATTQEAIIDMTSAYSLTNGYPATTSVGGTAYPAAASTSVPVTSVLRGIRIVGGTATGVMQVQDEITASATVPNVYWFMHTKQTVSNVTANSLVLTDSTGNNHVRVTLQSPSTASFIPGTGQPAQPMAATPLNSSPNPTQQLPAAQSANTGIQKIYLYLPSIATGTTTITVSLAPYVGTATPPANPPQTALSTW